MPKMKVCPNRKQHSPDSYREVIHRAGTDDEFIMKVPTYKKFKTPPGKRYVDYNPGDKMFRVYYRTLNKYYRTLWIRTSYWYCPKCDIVVHEEYIDKNDTESKYLQRDKSF